MSSAPASAGNRAWNASSWSRSVVAGSAIGVMRCSRWLDASLPKMDPDTGTHDAQRLTCKLSADSFVSYGSVGGELAREPLRIVSTGVGIHFRQARVQP